MDVGGSFLELSCVRVAIIPVGSPMTDQRFNEFSSHLTSFREIPVNALPRRAPVARPSLGASLHSTFSSMTPAMREAIQNNNGNTSNQLTKQQLARSHSSIRGISQSSKSSAYSLFSSSARNVSTSLQNSQSTRSTSSFLSTTSSPKSPDTTANNQDSKNADGSSDSTTQVTKLAPTMTTATKAALKSISPGFHYEIDLTSPEVDSSFRLRYQVIHRDHNGALLMRPQSEWDDFHSTKVWGVFGLVDGTNTNNSTEERDTLIREAINDFRLTLTHFTQSVVRRLIIFTPADESYNGPFVLNDLSHYNTNNYNTNSNNIKNNPLSSLNFSIGHVPDKIKSEETRLEVRAQLVHFSGLLLNEIDAECWRRRDSPASELFLSPLDDKLTSSDRQSKLAKRRAGRLDKLLGDSLLLMGSPSDALLKYSSAIERSKASSDRLWLAGAMEGWSAAHVLSHVGSGGSPNDNSLIDKLIDHYSEIYKLYQKKRVIEPEAVAALRLAEYLAKWTSRKKDAIIAAMHAANVGENLRPSKKSLLWQALATFSDRLGCRRKAALFLYRLGHLNGIQGVPSSAVELMVAAEQQLCIDDSANDTSSHKSVTVRKRKRKPWASLNRRVLLMAAEKAQQAGDSSHAAKLYVEALVTVTSGMDGVGDTDQGILKSLGRVQMPACLPAATDVVELDNISACQMYGLSIRKREDEDDDDEDDDDDDDDDDEDNEDEGENVEQGKDKVEHHSEAKTDEKEISEEQRRRSKKRRKKRRKNKKAKEIPAEIKQGPFIYNPFEAKKRAKEAADAKRTMTWVKNEAASVSVRLVSNIRAELVVDIIAILVNDVPPTSSLNADRDSEKQNRTETKSNGEIIEVDVDIRKCKGKEEEEEEENKVTSSVDDQVEEEEDGELSSEEECARHTTMVRELVDRSTELARTVPESVTAYPNDRYGTTKFVNVIPRQTGPLFIKGILIRLFNGALVVLHNSEKHNRKEDIEVPPVTVMHELAKVDVRARCSDGDEEEEGRARGRGEEGEEQEFEAEVVAVRRHGVVVYDGERRVVWIDVRNSGTEQIKWIRATVSCPNSKITEKSRELEHDDNDEDSDEVNERGKSGFKIVGDELSDCGKEVVRGLEKPGDLRTFRLEILGRYNVSDDSRNIVRTERRNGMIGSSNPEKGIEESVISSLSVMIEYEGICSKGIIRKSSAQIRVACRRAVGIGRLVMFENNFTPTNDQSSYCLAVEVRNYVSLPAKVTAIQLDPGETKSVPCSEETMVENGACARLLCTMSKPSVENLRNWVYSTFYKKGTHDLCYKDRVEQLAVQWNLGSMGRQGTVLIDAREVRKAAVKAWDIASKILSSGYGIKKQQIGIHANIDISLVNHLEQVNVGRCIKVRITVQNECVSSFPSQCTLDVNIGQRNDDHAGAGKKKRGVYVIGVTKKILVGAVESKKKMTHEVQVMVTSSGCFEISAVLYDAAADAGVAMNDAGEGMCDGSADGEYAEVTDDAVEKDKTIHPRTRDSLILSDRGSGISRRRRLLGYCSSSFYGV